jgi:O-antigen/teichoic acid export membrane protein
LIIIAFSSLLEDFFNFSSFYPFISLAVLLLTGVSLTFRKAFLQGASDFKAVSWSGIISAGAKLGFAILFVYLGWRSLGAISALLIAQALSLLYVYFKTKDSLNLSIFSKKGSREVIKSEYKYAILIFLATSAITFLYTADVLMVKHWFSREEAGLYSGIATIARIIFFATGSVCGVLLATVKIKNSPDLNKQILKKALVLIVLIAGGGLLIFSLFSETVINILIGERYVSLAPLLFKMSLLLVMVSIINLLFSYFLALRRYIIVGASLSGPLTIIILSLFDHGSLEQIVYNFLIGSMVVLAVLFKGIFFTQRA